MYSQCPECLTRFRVTAAALRAAHGTVRCGRCGSAFDALRRLTDSPHEDPLPVVETPANVVALTPAGDMLDAGLAGSATPQGGDDVVTEFHFSADDLEQVFIDARDWAQQFGNGPEVAPDDSARLPALRAAAGNVDDAGGAARDARTDVFVHEPEAIEDITMEGERIVIEAHSLPDDDVDVLLGEQAAVETGVGTPEAEFPTPAVEAAIAAAAPVHAVETQERVEDQTGVHRALDPEIAVIPEPVAVAATPDTEPATPATVVPFRLRDRRTLEEFPLEVPADDEGSGRGARALWGVGAALLALALAAQLVHHYRQELARHPSFGSPVRALYASLGRPFAPNWDPAAFELRQWGAAEPSAAPAGVMSVRASVRNGADFPQPLPLLRLELEDRYGNTVARRDFEPREWLADPDVAGRLLAAGAETEAELRIVEAGTEAVGYRLDVCLKADGERPRCARTGENP